MTKLFNENGFLSEYGAESFKQLDDEINVLLNSANDETELRLIGTLIQKRVGDAISNKAQAKKEIAAKFASMTDEQFEGYLKAKYGKNWLLVSLTPEEFARVPRLTKEDIENALEKGRQAMEDYYRNTAPFKPSKLCFK